MEYKRVFVAILAMILVISLNQISRADDTWTCLTCGRSNSEKANFCGTCGTQKTSQVNYFHAHTNAWICPNCGYSVPDENQFCSVCGTKYEAQDLAAIRREESAETESCFQPCIINSYPMAFQNKAGTETIWFQTPVDGKYQIWIEDQLAGTEYKLTLKDSNDQRISSNSLFMNQPSLTESLKGGESYQLALQYSSFQGTCTLCIGMPRSTQPIGVSRRIRDRMVYENQVNSYSFVADVSGHYRIEINELKQGNSMNLRLLDDQGYRLASTSLAVSRGGAVHHDLEAGKTYTIQAIQANGLEDYVLSIGRPNPTLDLSDAGAIGDSLHYHNQENTYLFKPEHSGDYLFTAQYLDSNDMSFDVVIRDMQGYQIKRREYMKRETFFSLHLEANETYQIVVKQKEALGEYTFLIKEQ